MTITPYSDESRRCPDCSTVLTLVRGRRSGSGNRYLWCWRCERAMRPGERRAVAEPNAGTERPQNAPRKDDVA